VKFPKVMKKTMGDGSEPRTQYAALPWRVEKSVEILLLTSRDTRRWIIPKGWPMSGRKPHATAALEALQEGGLLGKIEKRKLGAFHYRKRLKNGAAITCRVQVFPMRVMRQRKNWPEKKQRKTRWFPYVTAAQHVKEEELRELILSFGRSFAA
jgi:8-oxo-dGTP pyrophosphatase MutT (NUDIX family)